MCGFERGCVVVVDVFECRWHGGFAGEEGGRFGCWHCFLFFFLGGGLDLWWVVRGIWGRVGVVRGTGDLWSGKEGRGKNSGEGDDFIAGCVMRLRGRWMNG